MIEDQLCTIREELEPEQMTFLISGFIKKLQAVRDKRKNDNIDLPKGMIYISSGKRKTQFYLSESGNPQHRQYLNNKLDSVAIRYIQQEYNEKLIKALEWEINWFTKYLRLSRKKGIADISRLMCKSKRPFFHSVTYDDAEFRKKWSDRVFEKKGFNDGEILYMTSFNLRVRSKSEIIIAESLKNRGIPFIYEYPLTINERKYYPDFLCLNIRTRRTYVWEHFGQMDVASYVTRRMNKLKDYEEAGLLSGKNLITTEEDMEHPLNAASVDARISLFLI